MDVVIECLKTNATKEKEASVEEMIEYSFVVIPES